MGLAGQWRPVGQWHRCYLEALNTLWTPLRARERNRPPTQTARAIDILYIYDQCPCAAVVAGDWPQRKLLGAALLMMTMCWADTNCLPACVVIDSAPVVKVIAPAYVARNPAAALAALIADAAAADADELAADWLAPMSVTASDSIGSSQLRTPPPCMSRAALPSSL